MLGGKGELRSLDPYASNDNFVLGLLGNVYEGLVKRSPTGELAGALAERWEIVDDTHWRFYLRQNVKFQGGQDFTADDVVYSAARVRKNGSALTSILSADTKVIKVDDHTVEVVLADPNPRLIFEWDSWYMMSKIWIEPEESADPSKIDPQAGFAAGTANGTGPYSVSARKLAEPTTFAPNLDYWAGGPLKFDLVEFCSMPSTAERLNALLSSETDRVDWIDGVPPANWQLVLNSNNAKGVTSNDPLVMFLAFDVARDKLTGPNQDDPNPFKDPNIRKAIYQAIDFAAISSKMLGHNSPASSVVASTLFPPAKDVVRLPFDRDAAKALMAHTRYPDGFEATLECPKGRFANDKDICDWVGSMLFALGVQVTVNPLSWDKFQAKVLAGGGYDTSFALFGWSPGSLDGLDGLINLLACRGAENGRYNIGGYCNVAVDALIAQARLESDAGKRSDLVLQALQLAHQEAPVVPLHQQQALTGLSKLVDVGVRKDGQIRFEEFDKH
ncbi:ABC transporter substrate-binding protein [Tardiphaga sp. 538_B7_N1_4]|uniref:ABC transporter substrate-binding protein n=1 Tax=Tardiphaga sp. 538_B7_N1_4 TaxID=3240778 RepID=UPI003F258E51